MGFNYIKSLFKKHSCAVVGMKGSGKDVLMGNVVARRRLPYASNCNYGYDFHKFEYDAVDLRCTYKDIVKGKIPFYEYPYPSKCDIYLSDCGVYFPSQFCNELNRDYKSFPIFLALSRQLGDDVKVHTNCQYIGRVWDKLREQQDMYIYCEWICKPLLKIGLAVQSVIVYDKYESCANRVKPCRVRVPLLGKDRMNALIYCDDFYNKHGSVKRHLLIYRNLSKHDSSFFKKLFKEGKK